MGGRYTRRRSRVPRLWDILWEAGRPLGVIAAGGGAFDSLRLEKGYRLWGNDIHTDYNPYEAGLGFAVRMRKGDFIGRDALREIRARGTGRRLCCMTLDDPEAVVVGRSRYWTGTGSGVRDERELRTFDRAGDCVRVSADRVFGRGDGGGYIVFRAAAGGYGGAGAAV